jgi:tRNA modification GTPase
MRTNDDTIYAPATPPGFSALAIVRISGPDTLRVCEQIFTPASKHPLENRFAANTAHYGTIRIEDQILDEVVLTVFRAPHSYTGEDLAEISCHGSPYIVSQLCAALGNLGLRTANAGEFTLRAFLNGKMDLSRAEAVADLIASQTRSAHSLALNQMRGGFSQVISDLRAQLLEFSSLLTLELDFSEEDVEFANRERLEALLAEIDSRCKELVDSFALGNVLKSGIPVAIVGKPNVGKSTLLNAILNEEKAIVSDIPGTTRDAIEDTVNIEGIAFRFIDTAGLREAGDALEQIGMLRTIEKIAQARIILYVVDMAETEVDEIENTLRELSDTYSGTQKTFVVVANKTDLMVEAPKHFSELMEHEVVFISAKRRENIHLLMESLLQVVNVEALTDRTLLTNARHYEALNRTRSAVQALRDGMQSGLSADLLASDLNQALHYLGEITGEITTDEILGQIFGKFCIGK